VIFEGHFSDKLSKFWNVFWNFLMSCSFSISYLAGSRRWKVLAYSETNYPVKGHGLSRAVCYSPYCLNFGTIIIFSIGEDMHLTFGMLRDWLIEQCFMSPPAQYRLYGRRFLQVKRPNQQYQSTEGTNSTQTNQTYNKQTWTQKKQQVP